MNTPRPELAVVLASWSLNCGSTHVGPDTPSASNAGRSSEGHPVFSNCLPGNANIKTTRHWAASSEAAPSTVTEGGSCTIGASCIEQQGRDTPGDGQVSLTCSSGLANGNVRVGKRRESAKLRCYPAGDVSARRTSVADVVPLHRRNWTCCSRSRRCANMLGEALRDGEGSQGCASGAAVV